MQNILVVRGGALGDGLLTLPAVAALRTRWPAARLTLVGPRSLLPFACAGGFADQGEPIEEAAGLALLGDGGPSPGWARADLAVVWLQTWTVAARRLADWGAPDVIAGPSLPPAGAAVHVADHLCGSLGSLGIGPSRLAAPLATPTDAAALAQRWWQSQVPAGSTPVIAVHPGSGGWRKCWPLSRFASLVDRLTTTGYRVLVCLGPAETEDVARRQHYLDGFPNALLASGLTVDVMAGVIAQYCSAFIGNDAGMTHLAAALGVPTVAIFGPTDPVRWAPQGRRVHVLPDPAWGMAPRAGESDSWRLQPGDVEQACLQLLATGSSNFYS